jgi:para-nitrobenzyl esterase
MSRVLIIIFGVMIILGPFAAIGDENCEAPVRTGEGLVKGLLEPDLDACVWKGIPYAAPPIDDLRWKAPQPPLKHEDTLSAFEFGPGCMQNESFTSGGKSPAGLSEDCLTLNIWSPKKSGQFPVMYWIHGGGLTIGASNYEMYDGARLAAEQGVVLVSINYRLNIFGFFAHPDAALEDPNRSTGNYGIHDQIAGLEWVRDNIAAFSGDPGNVTIFGESAGGLSVCNLLASPPAKGLFHRAIIQSGGCDLTKELTDTYKQADAFAKNAGCEGKDELDCLRQISAEELMKIKAERFGTSHNDGYVIPATPIELIKKGDFNRVPVVVGNTRDEINLFLVPMGILSMPGFMIKRAMKGFLKDEYEMVMDMYPRSEYGRPAKRLLALASEAFCSRGFQAAEEISVYDPVYYYSHDWDDYFGGSVMGSFHGLEIPFAFGNVLLDRDSMKLVFRNEKVEARAKPLSDSMMGYWANFARTGDPNGPDLVKWPAYNTDTRRRIHFDTDITVNQIPDKQLKRYQYWSNKKISTSDLKF